MSIWFTSDLHLGHDFVARTRGFDQTAEHDDAVSDAWVAKVRAKDTVWVLGDLALANPTYALSVLAPLPGIKNLVWGNHDRGWPAHRNAHTQARPYMDVFASVQAFARRRIDGAEVMLSHFPYDGDTDGRPVDRHEQYRLRDLGLPLIHGHTHSTKFLTASERGSLQLHVGFDAHRRMVSLEEVAAQLAGGL